MGNNTSATKPLPDGKPPVVAGVWVYGGDLPRQGIRLDSAAWFAWLTAPTTTRFSYPVVDRRCGYIIGFMTVRKEGRQRGGSYWTAYRRQGARLRKIYLGVSQTLTQTRLDAVAATMLAERADQKGGKDSRLGADEPMQRVAVLYPVAVPVFRLEKRRLDSWNLHRRRHRRHRGVSTPFATGH